MLDNLFAPNTNSTDSSTQKWQPLPAIVKSMLIVGTKDQNFLSNHRERKSPEEDQAEHHT